MKKNLLSGRERDQKGAILITAVIIFSFLAVLGMNIVSFIFSRLVNTSLELDRLKALYLAEAGIAMSLHELKTNIDTDNNGLGNVLKASLGDGYYKASHNFQLSAITGVGEYNGVKRVIQVRYSAL